MNMNMNMNINRQSLRIEKYKSKPVIGKIYKFPDMSSYINHLNNKYMSFGVFINELCIELFNNLTLYIDEENYNNANIFVKEFNNKILKIIQTNTHDVSLSKDDIDYILENLKKQLKSNSNYSCNLINKNTNFVDKNLVEKHINILLDIILENFKNIEKNEVDNENSNVDNNIEIKNNKTLFKKIESLNSIKSTQTTDFKKTLNTTILNINNRINGLFKNNKNSLFQSADKNFNKKLNDYYNILQLRISSALNYNIPIKSIVSIIDNKSFYEKYFNNISKNLLLLFKNIKNIKIGSSFVKNIKQHFINVFKNIKKWTIKIFNKIKDFVVAIARTIVKIVSGVFSVILGLFSGIFGFLGSILSLTFNLLILTFTFIISITKQILKISFKVLKETSKFLVRSIKKIFSKEFWKDGFGRYIKVAIFSNKRIVFWISAFSTLLIIKITNIVTGLIDTIKSIVDFCKNLFLNGDAKIVNNLTPEEKKFWDNLKNGRPDLNQNSELSEERKQELFENYIDGISTTQTESFNRFLADIKEKIQTSNTYEKLSESLKICADKLIKVYDVIYSAVESKVARLACTAIGGTIGACFGNWFGAAIGAAIGSLIYGIWERNTKPGSVSDMGMDLNIRAQNNIIPQSTVDNQEAANPLLLKSNKQTSDNTSNSGGSSHYRARNHRRRGGKKQPESSDTSPTSTGPIGFDPIDTTKIINIAAVNDTINTTFSNISTAITGSSASAIKITDGFKNLLNIDESIEDIYSTRLTPAMRLLRDDRDPTSTNYITQKDSQFVALAKAFDSDSESHNKSTENYKKFCNAVSKRCAEIFGPEFDKLAASSTVLDAVLDEDNRRSFLNNLYFDAAEYTMAEESITAASGNDVVDTIYIYWMSKFLLLSIIDAISHQYIYLTKNFLKTDDSTDLQTAAKNKFLLFLLGNHISDIRQNLLKLFIFKEYGGKDGAKKQRDLVSSLYSFSKKDNTTKKFEDASWFQSMEHQINEYISALSERKSALQDFDSIEGLNERIAAAPMLKHIMGFILNFKSLSEQMKDPTKYNYLAMHNDAFGRIVDKKELGFDLTSTVALLKSINEMCDKYKFPTDTLENLLNAESIKKIDTSNYYFYSDELEQIFVKIFEDDSIDTEEQALIEKLKSAFTPEVVQNIIDAIRARKKEISDEAGNVYISEENAIILEQAMEKFETDYSESSKNTNANGTE